MEGSTHHDDRFTPEDHALIAALADGSLPSTAAAAARQRLTAEADLRTALTAQERAVVLLRSTRVPVPDALRDRLVEYRARAPAQGRLGEELRFALNSLQTRTGAALAAGATILVILLLLSLSGGGSSAPTVARAAALGALGPDAPAPRPARERGLLDLEVQGVAFPSWRRRFGWHATGSRVQGVSGRFTRSVFYAKGGATLAYTILAAPQLDWPAASSRTIRESVELHTLVAGGREIVTWRRLGHTCVLSGAGVTAAELIRLAVWRGGGAVRF